MVEDRDGVGRLEVETFEGSTRQMLTNSVGIHLMRLQQEYAHVDIVSTAYSYDRNWNSEREGKHIENHCLFMIYRVWGTRESTE